LITTSMIANPCSAPNCLFINLASLNRQIRTGRHNR
jgi:hypothetical protein